jgi:hypothetical protein
MSGTLNGLFKQELLLLDSTGWRFSPAKSIQRRVVEQCLFGGGLRIEIPRCDVLSVRSCLNVPCGVVTREKTSVRDRSFHNRYTRGALCAVACGFAHLEVHSQIFYSVVNPPVH